MGKPETCMRCGSTDVIPTARLYIRGNVRDYGIAVDRKPGAALAPGTEREDLRTCVCAACGHVETFVLETANLKAAYEEYLKRSSTP